MAVSDKASGPTRRPEPWREAGSNDGETGNQVPATSSGPNLLCYPHWNVIPAWHFIWKLGCTQQRLDATKPASRSANVIQYSNVMVGVLFCCLYLMSCGMGSCNQTWENSLPWSRVCGRWETHREAHSPGSMSATEWAKMLSGEWFCECNTSINTTWNLLF
jgi:hypothetical protein